MRLEELNLRDPIKIGFYDPFDALPPIKDDFTSKFPLSNLHWRYNPLKPVKSIPLLPVELEEEFPSIHKKKPSSISKPLDNVYTRLMFIKSTDIDSYRSQVRPLISEWLKTLVKRDNVSWAIILVSSAGKKDNKSTIMKTSVLDKLKLDFGPGGKHIEPLRLLDHDNDSSTGTYEHILRVEDHFSDEITKIEVYNNVVATIKSSILSTFNKRFIESSTVIEKLHLISNQSPLERLELFREKLRLASILNDMKCLEESLNLYEKLFAELQKSEFSEAKSIDIPNFLDDIDYKSFDPETIPRELEPYFKFCSAVENRIPIDIFSIKLGIFLKVSILLQASANFATSISISSIFISSLLQKSVALFNDYFQSYRESIVLDQWLFAMADFHSNLPLANKLVELGKVQSENKDGVRSVTGILEYSAELKLLKRSILNRLAKNKCFELPTSCLFLSEVSVEKDGNNLGESHDFKLTFEKLALSLANQHSYEEQFEHLTISAIQDYADCDRIKTIDILSIDLAMLHYRKHEYREALEILQNSYEYFIQNGWNYVGGMLLEIFLDCIQHVESESNEHFLKTTPKLFASLNNKNPRSHGINDYSLVKTKNERLKLFRQLISISKSLESNHEFPLEDIFIIDIQPYIAVEDDGRYYIQASIQNKFGIQIELSRVTVTLSSTTDDNIVNFSRENVAVGNENNAIIELYTNKFCHDLFRIDNISVEVTDKLTFSTLVDHSSTEQADITVVQHGEIGENQSITRTKSLSKKLLNMFPHPGQVRIEIVSPTKMNLGTSSLDCIIHSGSRAANNISLSVSTSTPGLQIANELKRYDFKYMKENDQVRLQFDCNTESKLVDIRVICQYEIDGEKFEYIMRHSHDLSLQISVSVQDIFKPNAIYSKFQIGCVDPQYPVRVSKCDYKCTQGKYNVTNSSTIANDNISVVVYGEQPASIFYRLVPTSDVISSSDILDFTIRYSNLQKECESFLQAVLQQELKKIGKERYFFLLSPVVYGFKFDLPRYSIDGSVCARNLIYCANLMNEIVEKHVPSKHRTELIDILLRPFNDNVLMIQKDMLVVAGHNELYIPVSVPSLNMLHHVQFLLEEKRPFIVGEPINVKLLVESSSKWSDLSPEIILASSSPRQSIAKQKINFELTVLNDEDWLISGLKKSNFCVEDRDTTTEINLCLIPLNAGELLLPKITIEAVDNELFVSDLVQENGLETVLVIPEIANVTFAF